MERYPSTTYLFEVIIIGKELSKETKEKRTEAFYKKAITKAEKDVGEKYNRLTITEIDYERTRHSYFEQQYHRVYVKTQCDCGSISEISTPLPAIKCGHIKSCGCLKFNNPLNFEDLTGKKFGRLTVIKRDLERDISERKQNKNRVHWLCKCDCGNTTLSSVNAYLLKNGYTQSCGCYASEQIAKRNKKHSTKTNNIKVNCNNTVTIFDDKNNECLIDEGDYSVLKRWYWRKIDKRGNKEKGYWVTNVKDTDKYDKSVLMLHQVVAEIKFGKYDSKKYVPDHLSRDTNDNRKCNILLKSNMDNSKNRGISKSNSSGKTGVSFNNQKNMWVAYITVNYKTIHLGAFIDFNKAVEARRNAEKEYGFTCDDVVASYDKEI